MKHFGREWTQLFPQKEFVFVMRYQEKMNYNQGNKLPQSWT